MQGRIPTTVITGFLGAGKTTMIRQLLDQADGKRIALIINEFGEQGVDREILRGCNIEGCGESGLVELANGCICCRVAEEFEPAILSLVSMDQPPDHIIIETSGLALPQPLLRAFNWPALRNRLTVDGVVALLDGPAVDSGEYVQDRTALDRQRLEDDSLDHDTPVIELFEDQLASADMVVINKIDLMPPDSVDPLRKSVQGQLRPGVSVVTARHGAVDLRTILGIDAEAESSLADREEIHHRHEPGEEQEPGAEPDHDHDEFDSAVIALPELADLDRFLEVLAEQINRHRLLRVKGFAAVKGKPMRLIIQAVGPRINCHFDKPFETGARRTTSLVAIGEAGIDWPAVESGLQLRAGT